MRGQHEQTWRETRGLEGQPWSRVVHLPMVTGILAPSAKGSPLRPQRPAEGILPQVQVMALASKAPLTLTCSPVLRSSPFSGLPCLVAVGGGGAKASCCLLSAWPWAGDRPPRVHRS